MIEFLFCIGAVIGGFVAYCVGYQNGERSVASFWRLRVKGLEEQLEAAEDARDECNVKLNSQPK